jgi:argininosuccinate lyase/amino-acid N-acetyltransferase
VTALAYATALQSPIGVLAAEPLARPARVADAGTIQRLIAAWTAQGFTLPRGFGNILGSLGDFAVVESPVIEGRVIACAALEHVAEGIAEIRSVAVDPLAARSGSGRIVVRHLIAEATARGLHTVVLLTKAPGFFERCGFTSAEPESLPNAYTHDHLPRHGRVITGRTPMIHKIRDTGHLHRLA